MTGARQSGLQRPRRNAAAPAGRSRDKTQVRAVRLYSLAAVLLLGGQITLGLWIGKNVAVPAADNGAGIFTAIGRALTNGPASLTLHASLGLVLLLTALAAAIRAVQSRRVVAIVCSLAGLAAIAAANIEGARFVGSGHDADSSTMETAGIIALVSYLLCLALLRNAHRRRQW